MQIDELHIVLNKVNKNIININSSHFILLHNLLDLMGIPYIIPNGEGEAFCAKLYKCNLVHGCVSEDTDILVNGGKIFIRNFNPENNYIDEYNLDNILDNLEMNYNQFIDLCILCGCDYTSKIIGIGPLTAYKFIKKYNNIENIIEYLNTNKTKYKIPSDFNYIKARDLFLNVFDDFDHTNFKIKLTKPNIDDLLLFINNKSDKLKQKYKDEIKKDLLTYYDNILNNIYIQNTPLKIQTNMFSYITIKKTKN
jgi:flap endonuclease-1